MSLVSQVVMCFSQGWSSESCELHLPEVPHCLSGQTGTISLLLADGTGTRHAKHLRLVVKLLVCILPAGCCSCTHHTPD